MPGIGAGGSFDIEGIALKAMRQAIPMQPMRD